MIPISKALVLSVLLTYALASTVFEPSYILPEVFVRHCVGPACPSFSVPIRSNETNHPVAGCESDKNRVVPDPKNCQSYFVCRNGTGVKYTCTIGYAFHPKMKLCLPETMVKSCGRVYCPPTMVIGVIPDPKNCTRYYRCIYSLPIHYQCESGSIYDIEMGKCKNFGNNVPECIPGAVGNGTVSPSTTTALPDIPSTTLINDAENPGESVSTEATPTTVPTPVENVTTPATPVALSE